ncbi:hypothetical protein B7P43_G15148 [Cryptotermes secundus]|uniref:Uncharacterized protein n=1 Tax=Cryptotermes secundus TaxID=105785 RepID=A0A2J7RS60_9NEOP|nr:hypothetical protein B7P43_G15148 [Cryptotermes secundus]
MNYFCVKVVMSLKENEASTISSGDNEYDENKTEMLYHTLKQNVQQIAVQMKNYSEILQDLAKDMDNVSKSMAAVQEHSLNTRNDK